MKPNFALSLSFDGIRLLLRAAGGWQLVGEVDVADPDLPGALAALHKIAEAHRPEGIHTKLIIPNEQIRYLSVDTGPLNDADRTDAARLALEGATPYPVDALVFDISAEGSTTHVAAIARETLAEAEAFATEHAFNPVSFVAAPDDAGFLGEPYFGPTAQSKSLLPNGAVVEPDGVRVVVVADAPPPSPPAAPAIPKAPERDDTAPQQDPATDDGVLFLTTGAQPDAPTVIDDGDIASEPVHVDTNPASTKDTQELGNAPVSSEVQDGSSESSSRAAPKQNAETAPAQSTPPGHSAIDQLPDAVEDPGQTVSDPKPLDTIGINEPHVVLPKADTSPVAGAALGFASRRSSKPTAAAPLGGVTRKLPPAPPARPTPVSPPPAPRLPPQATVDSLRKIEPPVLPPEPEPVPEPKATDTGSFLSRRKAPKVARANAPGHARPGDTPTAAKVEARRMTIFGARDTAQVGGKPRYLGLILMAALLVFLAGVAAWATVFLDDGLARLFQGRERTLASTLPEETQSTLANDVGATTEPPNEAAADGVELASLSDTISDGLTSEDAAVLDALRDPLPDPQDTPEALDGSALEARYAVTGIWPKAPDGVEPAETITLDDLYITGIDPISPALDAVALPSVTSFQTDSQLAVVTSPVAAGTDFALGTNGRVIATVEGAISPDGHTVFLGRPPIVPPATPVRFATDPTETGTLETTTQLRPRARPVDLIEQNERATLGGLSRSELSGLRPRLRPQALQQQAEEQQQANAPEDAPPSALATAQSLRPKTRPGGFAQLVARATPNLGSTAATTAAPTPAPASVAPRTVKPSIPSSASVSREATTRNAINLRKVNLIGVYGKPSDRRALVRLSNGRYRKVQVGDRIDGGRVSAIGDSELRYQKGSRNLILKMPKG